MDHPKETHTITNIFTPENERKKKKSHCVILVSTSDFYFCLRKLPTVLLTGSSCNISGDRALWVQHSSKGQSKYNILKTSAVSGYDSRNILFQ